MGFFADREEREEEGLRCPVSVNADSCGKKLLKSIVSVVVCWPLVSSVERLLDLSAGKIAWNYGHSSSVAAIGRLWFSFLFLVISVSAFPIWVEGN